MPLLHVPKPHGPQVVDKVTQLGKSLFASGMLFDANGKLAKGRPVQFRWDKGQAQLHTDDFGAVQLKLTKQNARNLVVEVPDGLKLALELTDNTGNPVPLPQDPDFDKEKLKSAGGKLIHEVKGQLTEKEPLDKIRADMVKRKVNKGCFYKLHTFKMEAGSTYTIDLQSTDFDAFLRLEDPNGKLLGEDDDGAGKLNSRIVFTPETDGIYRLIVTTCDPDQTGNYRLAIYQTDAKEDGERKGAER
jgi:hypothetical protein